MLTLEELQLKLKQRLIGQNNAANRLSILVYKYLIKLHGRDSGIYFNSPSTMLLIGPTGCGKTHSLKILADLTELPFFEINCKSISQEGWVGHPLRALLISSIGANKGGIIFMDEFDKIVVPESSGREHNSNFHIQASILKYIEGMKLMIDNIDKKETSTLVRSIDLSNFIFVFAGAFSGLYDGKPQVGFTGETAVANNLRNKLTEYGMLPELLGRMQEIILYSTLTIEDYMSMLTNRHGEYIKWVDLLLKLDIPFHLDEKEVLREVEKLNLGARGFIQLIESKVSECIQHNIDKIDLEKFSPLFIGNKNENYKI